MIFELDHTSSAFLFSSADSFCSKTIFSLVKALIVSSAECSSSLQCFSSYLSFCSAYWYHSKSIIYTLEVKSATWIKKKDAVYVNNSFIEYLTWLFSPIRPSLAEFSMTTLLNLAILASIFLFSWIAAWKIAWLVRYVNNVKTKQDSFHEIKTFTCSASSFSLHNDLSLSQSLATTSRFCLSAFKDSFKPSNSSCIFSSFPCFSRNSLSNYSR